MRATAVSRATVRALIVLAALVGAMLASAGSKPFATRWLVVRVEGQTVILHPANGSVRVAVPAELLVPGTQAGDVVTIVAYRRERADWRTK